MYYTLKTTAADFFQIYFYPARRIDRRIMIVFSQKKFFYFLFYFTKNFLQRSDHPYFTRAFASHHRRRAA
ncbi:hypothetical protein HMPREF1633_07780 [Tissierellia bacterium S5-A11]|nr:hypothetical protein HMPREF1633_07780 [Tissierellia bacterium S5-A11]